MAIRASSPAAFRIILNGVANWASQGYRLIAGSNVSFLLHRWDEDLGLWVPDPSRVGQFATSWGWSTSGGPPLAGSANSLSQTTIEPTTPDFGFRIRPDLREVFQGTASLSVWANLSPNFESISGHRVFGPRRWFFDVASSGSLVAPAQSPPPAAPVVEVPSLPPVEDGGGGPTEPDALPPESPPDSPSQPPGGGSLPPQMPPDSPPDVPPAGGGSPPPGGGGGGGGGGGAGGDPAPDPGPAGPGFDPFLIAAAVVAAVFLLTSR